MANNFELRSEEVQAVLKKTPPIITRWGATAIFIVTICLYVVSFFIHVYDKVEGRFVLSNDGIGKMYISAQNTGLIKPGQDILVELENYPSSTFGQLMAKVDYLDFDEKKEEYVVIAKKLDSLYTTFNITIERLPLLSGKGAIILNEKKFLHKILPFTQNF